VCRSPEVTPLSLTKEKIEQLAPDQASLGAALKLVKPASWPMLGRNADAALLWGECQGSGALPYRVVVSPDDLGYKCTCPSRKFPCKHVLAVMWMQCDKPERFLAGPSPDWAEEWLSRRRPRPGGPKPGRTKPSEGEGDAEPAAAASVAVALEAIAAEKPADPAAAARAEAQRQRLLQEREATVLEGLDDLDRWIVDQLNLGLSGFAQRAVQSTKTLSTRLVDAKAPGLARRLDMLAAEIYRTAEQRRDDLVLERLAALSLISAAYRNQDRLPAPLRADVRRATGWTARREELLADPDATRVSGNWLVAATRSEVQPDRLRRLETWLMRVMPEDAAPAIALLIDFVPVSAGSAASPFLPGEALFGEVVFYPSATPLRALLATRSAAMGPIAWPTLPDGLAGALATFETALARQPWLELWPLGASGLRVERLSRSQLALVDAGGHVLPIDRTQADALIAMLGLTPISALFTWDGWSATLLAAETPIGRWHEA
jgi:hypothetical protein